MINLLVVLTAFIYISINQAGEQGKRIGRGGLSPYNVEMEQNPVFMQEEI
jgi:hypothetical protein